jgi:hypothetical protein
MHPGPDFFFSDFFNPFWDGKGNGLIFYMVFEGLTKIMESVVFKFLCVMKMELMDRGCHKHPVSGFQIFLAQISLT